jgi:hypothetical protein
VVYTEDAYDYILLLLEIRAANLVLVVETVLLAFRPFKMTPLQPYCSTQSRASLNAGKVDIFFSPGNTNGAAGVSTSLEAPTREH